VTTLSLSPEGFRLLGVCRFLTKAKEVETSHPVFGLAVAAILSRQRHGFMRMGFAQGHTLSVLLDSGGTASRNSPVNHEPHELHEQIRLWRRT
jgi:hypothetical protein